MLRDIKKKEPMMINRDPGKPENKPHAIRRGDFPSEVESHTAQLPQSKSSGIKTYIVHWIKILLSLRKSQSKPSSSSQSESSHELRPEPSRKLQSKSSGIKTYFLPNLLTVANMSFGLLSIIFAIRGEYVFSSYAIGAATILSDLFDSQMARITTTSVFGIRCDSFSDMASFIMAPTLMMYFWALQPFGVVGGVACFVFLACGFLHLIRFNTQVEQRKIKNFQIKKEEIEKAQMAQKKTFWSRDLLNLWREEIGNEQVAQKKSRSPLIKPLPEWKMFSVPQVAQEKIYFHGLPMSMAAGIVAGSVLCFRDLELEASGNMLLLLMTFMLGITMVSPFHHTSFKERYSEREKFYILILITITIYLRIKPDVIIFALWVFYALRGFIRGIFHYDK